MPGITGIGVDKCERNPVLASAGGGFGGGRIAEFAKQRIQSASETPLRL
jgi:hypothetical protein